jgi:hypothetical protein
MVVIGGGLLLTAGAWAIQAIRRNWRAARGDASVLPAQDDSA